MGGLSVQPDPSWQRQSGGDGYAIYRTPDDLLVVWTEDGFIDTAESATQIIEAQHAYRRQQGVRGGTVIMMDFLLEQNMGARTAYQTLPDPVLITGFALVGGTLFGRAAASVFLGVRRPPVPTKAFAELSHGEAWLRALST